MGFSTSDASGSRRSYLLHAGQGGRPPRPPGSRPTCRGYEPADYTAVVELLSRAYGGQLVGLEEFLCLRRSESLPPRQIALSPSGRRVIGFGSIVRYINLEAGGVRRLCVVVDPDCSEPAVVEELHASLVESLCASPDCRVHLRAPASPPWISEFLICSGYHLAGSSIDLELDVDQADISDLDRRLAAVQSQGVRISTLAEHLGGDEGRCLRYHELWCDLERTDPLYGSVLSSPREPFLAWLKHPRRDLTTCHVAQIGETLVGTTLLAPVPGDCGVLEQKATGVAQAYRRRGIALALKKSAIRSARKRGAHTIIAQNALEDAAMLALNTRLGFQRVRTFRILEAPLSALRASARSNS